MEYSANALNAVKQQYTGAALGGMPGNAPPVPRTIASAAGRIDELNARLGKATEALSMISSQIGAMVPVNGKEPGPNEISPGGAVYRLNDAADTAHYRIAEIENMITAIGRALG